MRCLLRCLAAIVVALSLSLPFAAGQKEAPTIERGVRAEDAQSEKSGSSAPVFPYFVLVIYTLLVMTIVCMPSRKA
jgi:hypothetical protein